MLRYEAFDFEIEATNQSFMATYCDIDIAEVRPLAFLLAGLDQALRGRKFEQRRHTSPETGEGFSMRAAQKEKEIYFGLSVDEDGWYWLDAVDATELRLALQKFFNLLRPSK